MRWVGDVDFAKKMKKRKARQSVERNVDRAWIKWVLNVSKLDQFKRRGYVPPDGGQRRWKPNADSTVEQKGHDVPLQGPGRMRFGGMARSYAISKEMRGKRTKMFGLFNRKTVNGHNLATIHHHGTRDGHIPARRQLRFYGRETRAYLQGYAAWILNGRRARRGRV